MLLGRQALIAEHQHAVLEMCLPHARERRVVERGRQIEADDLGEERPAQPVHLEHAV